MSRDRRGNLTIDSNAPSVRLSARQLCNQVLCDLPPGVPGSPNDHATRNLDDGLVGILQDDTLWLNLYISEEVKDTVDDTTEYKTDLFDHRLGQDLNLALLKCRLRIVDELFAKHWEYRRKGFDERYANFPSELGVP